MKKKFFLPIITSSLLTVACLSSSLIVLQSASNQPLVEEITKLPSSKNDGECNHKHVIYHERLEPSLTKAGHIEFYFCADCYKSYYDSKCTLEVEDSNLGLNNKNDGRYIAPITGSFSLIPQNIKDYLNAEKEKDIIQALRNKSHYNNQAERTIAWPNKNDGPYKVEISLERSFEHFDSYDTDKNIYAFDGIFIPGETYYYRVKDVLGNFIYDDLSFKVDDSYSLRLMNVDGISNMRDIGGWTGINGIKIPYGKIYRGGSLSNLSTSGKEIFLGKLGIKTEIDLRGAAGYDGAVQDVVDPRLNYQKCSIPAYTSIVPDYGVFNDAGDYLGFNGDAPAGIKKIFELLANKDNYPFYAHCSAGADRTGTIIFLINALLGVSYEDLTKDFELTTFSIYGDRYRSDVDETTMTFTDKGFFHNFVAIWDKLNYVMINKYGAENGMLYSAVENFLKTECDISDETIASVRLNMLDKVVDFD